MSLDLSTAPTVASSDPSGRRSNGNLSPSKRPDKSGVSTIWARWSQRVGRLVRLIVRILTTPFRLYASLRRSMTVASVSALLAAFMTLNVIWGFPWSGLMGACFAFLIVGFAINRAMRPNLKISVSLPRSAVAGNPFSVNVRLFNLRFVPAINLRVGWHREGAHGIYSQNLQCGWDASPTVPVDILRQAEQMQWHGTMRFDKRGIHELPPFQVASTFPFHLFHYRKGVGTQTKIAIIPASIGGDDDPASRVMLAAIGDWAKQLVAGAPVEYIGNREYQVGVPVRRWDFASWARLGRPIVREYQSPSIQSVTLIVDTSQIAPDGSSRLNSKQDRIDAEALFERLMSVSATAIAGISSRRIQLKLFLTCESANELPMYQSSAQPSEGNELMLVRLAAAQPMDPELAEQRIRDAIESSRSQPVLIFSLLDLDCDQRENLAKELPPNATYLPIKPPQPVSVGASS